MKGTTLQIFESVTLYKWIYKMLTNIVSAVIVTTFTLTSSQAMEETSKWKWLSSEDMPQNMKRGIYARETRGTTEPRITTNTRYSLIGNSTGLYRTENREIVISYPITIEVDLETTFYQNWNGWYQYWGKLVDNSLLSFSHPYSITNQDVKNILVLLSGVPFKDIENLEDKFKIVEYHKITDRFYRAGYRYAKGYKWEDKIHPGKIIAENLCQKNIITIKLLAPTFNIVEICPSPKGIVVWPYDNGYDIFGFDKLQDSLEERRIKLCLSGWPR